MSRPIVPGREARVKLPAELYDQVKCDARAAVAPVGPPAPHTVARP